MSVKRSNTNHPVRNNNMHTYILIAIVRSLIIIDGHTDRLYVLYIINIFTIQR